MKNRKKTLLRRAVLILLGLLLGLNVYLLNARVIAGNPMPMPFGIGGAVVQSGSMEPTYRKGDLLLVRQRAAYAVGDIVVYQSAGVPVVHRITAIDGNTVITKGDANNTADAPFAVTQIKGGVFCRIPFAGLVIDFFKTPLGIVLLLGCAVALVEVSFRREKRAAAHDERQMLQKEIERLRQEHKS